MTITNRSNGEAARRFVFNITATAPSWNTRSRLLGRNSPGTVIEVDHSISRCKLSAPETHIRALPVLPGPAPGKKRLSAATGPRHRVGLVNGGGTRGMRVWKGRRDRRGGAEIGVEHGFILTQMSGELASGLLSNLSFRPLQSVDESLSPVSNSR